MFTSCTNGQNNGNIIPIIDIESNVDNMDKIYLSQFTNEVKYIALESNSDYPLAYLIYLDLSEKFLLASDGKSCLLYDNEGHFIRSIGKNGRGPEEYKYISNIFLINGKIFLQDLYDLIEYKLDGTFAKKYKNCFLADGKYFLHDSETFIINDSMILGHIENSTGQIDNKAVIVDRSGKIKYYFKNYTLFYPEPGKFGARRPEHASIYKFDNRILYLEPFNDTLFQLNDQYQLLPEYVFNLGKFGESISDRKKPLEEYDGTKFFHLVNTFQTENLLFVSCDFGKLCPAKRLTQMVPPIPTPNKDWGWYNTRIVLGIFDKKSKKFTFSKPTSTDNHLFTSGLYNDIDAGPRFLPTKMVDESTMLMSISFHYFREHIASNDFKLNIPKYPEKKKELDILTDSLIKVGFDNPILMFITFTN
jgi:hypothetical protein